MSRCRILTQRIVDVGIARHNAFVVLHSGISMVVAALLALVGGTACTYYSVPRGAVGFGADFAPLGVSQDPVALLFADLDTLRTGSLITRLTNDVTQLQDMVTMMLRVMVRMPLLLIGSMVMGSITCPHLAPLFFVLVPLVVVDPGVDHRPWSFPMFAGVQQAIDRLNSVVQENLPLAGVPASSRRSPRADHGAGPIFGNRRRPRRAKYGCHAGGRVDDAADDVVGQPGHCGGCVAWRARGDGGRHQDRSIDRLR